MQSVEYKKYIKSSKWQQKRQERIEIDHHKCAMCGCSEKSCKKGLQVHHISYKHLTNEDVLTELVSLCPSCHMKIHRINSKKGETNDR